MTTTIQASQTGFSFGDLLDTSIAAAGVKFPEPAKHRQPRDSKPKTQSKILVALLTGADSGRLSLPADPASVKGSKGQDHMITVLLGPTSNSVGHEYWDRIKPSNFKAHFVRLGQMYHKDDDPGVVVPRSVRAFKNYHHQCICGHVDTVNGLEAESKRFVKACKKCKKSFDGLGTYANFMEFAEANTLMTAWRSGKVEISEHQDNDTIVKVHIGTEWKSCPKDRLVVKHGQKIKAEDCISSGWREIRPRLPAATPEHRLFSPYDGVVEIVGFADQVTLKLAFAKTDLVEGPCHPDWCKPYGHPTDATLMVTHAGVPKSSLKIKHGDPIKARSLMAYRPKQEPLVFELLRSEIELARKGIFTEYQENVMPILTGVFPKGRAPGKYDLAAKHEFELISRYAERGLEKEFRPYRLLKGIPNLMCDWRWILPAVSVGWVPVASLYSACPAADKIGQWDPGFKHELTVVRRRK